MAKLYRICTHKNSSPCNNDWILCALFVATWILRNCSISVARKIITTVNWSKDFPVFTLNSFWTRIPENAQQEREQQTHEMFVWLRIHIRTEHYTRAAVWNTTTTTTTTTKNLWTPHTASECVAYTQSRMPVPVSEWVNREPMAKLTLSLLIRHFVRTFVCPFGFSLCFIALCLHTHSLLLSLTYDSNTTTKYAIIQSKPIIRNARSFSFMSTRGVLRVYGWAWWFIWMYWVPAAAAAVEQHTENCVCLKHKRFMCFCMICVREESILL